MDKWTELTDEQEILDIVSRYQLDFLEISQERLVDLEVEKLLRKGAIEEVEPCKNQFLSNIFTIPKKGGERRPSGRHEDPEQFHRNSSFQNGRSFAPAISPPEGEFYVQDRPTRCISNHSDCEKIKDLSTVSLERETAPVHMSTFWPQTLSKNFHKGSETPLGLPQSSGSSTAGVIIIASFKTTGSSNPGGVRGGEAP